MPKLICCYFLASFILAGTIKAQEIVVFGTASKEPKIWLEGDTPKGMLVDILNLIGKKMAVKFKIKLYPWNRALHLAENNEGGIVGFSKNEERLKNYDFSDPIFIDEIMLVVMRGKEFEFEKAEDLKGKRIGTTRGTSYGPLFEEARKYFLLNEDDNMDKRLHMLMLGRIDVAIINPGIPGLKTLINKNPELKKRENDFIVLKKRISLDPNHLAFKKDMHMKDFLDRFNKTFHLPEIQSEIDKIYKNYSMKN